MILIWWYVSDFFNFVYSLLSSVISWIVSIISVIVAAISFLFTLFFELPSFLKVPLIGVVSISVIYKLLGRGEQS